MDAHHYQYAGVFDLLNQVNRLNSFCEFFGKSLIANLWPKSLWTIQQRCYPSMSPIPNGWVVFPGVVILQ